MSAVSEATRTKVKNIVCDVLELEDGEVTTTSLFVEDHGADSMRAIEILASLELAFGVTIDQSQLERMVNLEGVYQVLEDCSA